MLEVKGSVKFGRHASGTCQEETSFPYTDVIGVFLVPFSSDAQLVISEIALAQRTLRCSVIQEFSIQVCCWLFNIQKKGQVNGKPSNASFQNLGEKARTFTLDVQHELLKLALCKAVANIVSVFLYFFSFLRCQRQAQLLTEAQIGKVNRKFNCNFRTSSKLNSQQSDKNYSLY